MGKLHTIMGFLARMAALCVLLAQAEFAFASFIGDTVQINGGRFTFNNNQTTDVVVGAGVEATGSYTDINTGDTWLLGIDIGASSITLTLADNRPNQTNTLEILNGIISISGLDWIGAPNRTIQSATITSPVPGLGSNDLFVFAHAIDLIPDNDKQPKPNPVVPWRWTEGQVVVIQLNTPEPGTLFLLITGLLAVVGIGVPARR